MQLDWNDLKSWYLGDILKLMTIHGTTLKDYALVHLADNLLVPHSSMYDPFYREWKVVYRNYWWNQTSLTPLFQERVLNYFPLGYSFPMQDARINYDILPSISRTHTIGFHGNARSGNFNRAGNIRQYEQVTGVNVTGTVQKLQFGMGSREIYRDIMLNSKFCISIAGRFIECYRLFDALEVDCIVVIVDMFDNFDYTQKHMEQLLPLLSFPWTNKDGKLITRYDMDPTQVPYNPSIYMNQPKSRKFPYLPFNTGGDGTTIVPFIYTKTVWEFNVILKKLLANPEMMHRMQEESTLWWGQMKEFYRTDMGNQLCTGTSTKI